MSPPLVRQLGIEGRMEDVSWLLVDSDSEPECAPPEASPNPLPSPKVKSPVPTKVPRKQVVRSKSGAASDDYHLPALYNAPFKEKRVRFALANIADVAQVSDSWCSPSRRDPGQHEPVPAPVPAGRWSDHAFLSFCVQGSLGSTSDSVRTQVEFSQMIWALVTTYLKSNDKSRQGKLCRP